MKSRFWFIFIIFLGILIKSSTTLPTGTGIQNQGIQGIEPITSQSHYLEICQDGSVGYNRRLESACRQYLIQINKHSTTTQKPGKNQGQNSNKDKNPFKTIFNYWKMKIKMFFDRMTRGLGVVSTRAGDFARNFFKNLQYYYEEFEKGIKEGSFDRD